MLPIHYKKKKIRNSDNIQSKMSKSKFQSLKPQFKALKPTDNTKVTNNNKVTKLIYITYYFKWKY